MKAENKDGVENDIGHRADQDGQHARLGKALGGDKGVHAKRQLDENGADGVDVHIADAVLDGVFAGAERQEEIPVSYQQNDG